MIYTADRGILPTPYQRIARLVAKLKFVYLLPIGVSGMAIFWIALLLTIVAIHPKQNIQVPPPIVFTAPASSTDGQASNTVPAPKTTSKTLPVSVATPSTQPIPVGVAPASE
jgi:hypothetical protein